MRIDPADGTAMLFGDRPIRFCKREGAEEREPGGVPLKSS
jgi:hypothetical protein